MSVKLYRNNESGEVVAAVTRFTRSKDVTYAILKKGGAYTFLARKVFNRQYTPLPEAPEVYSKGLWAWMIMLEGNKVQKKNSSEKRPLWINTKDGVFDLMVGDDIADFSLFHFMNGEWVLYSGNKSIVELLPHELPQDVLCRNSKEKPWQRADIVDVTGYVIEDSGVKKHLLKDAQCIKFGVTYCIPFEGNEHLEGQITDGKHGAVPKGYVPPHVPQLGDDDYWCVGDEIINLSTLETARVVGVFDEKVNIRYHKNNDSSCFLGSLGSFTRSTLRVWFHSCSTIEKEHIPTRPHKIIDTDTDGA